MANTAHVTLISKPVPQADSKLKQLLKSAREVWREFALRPLGVEREDGHAAVNRSLITGLKKLNYGFNLNPLNLSHVASTVVVLSNVDALRQFIALKNEKKIKVLLAGPNLVVRATDEDSILASPAIDAIITPSTWVTRLYDEEINGLKDKTFTWPSGVDSQFWSPQSSTTKNWALKKALVYWKTEGEPFCNSIEKVLAANGWTTTRIKYGAYRLKRYRQLLNECNLAVFVSRSESQGLALAEAWSMNVPTLVFNPEEVRVGSHLFKNVSSAPYLNLEVGAYFKTLGELETLVKMAESRFRPLEPRGWILKNMTDEVSSRLFIELIHKVEQLAKSRTESPHATA